MEKVKSYLPLIIGGIVAIAFFFISRKFRQSSGNSQERSEILEKAREAKLAKSILKKSENEESTSNIES